MHKTIFALIVLIFIQKIEAQSNNINPDSILIVRDEWGTPHIFAKTDPEVAYGLAWANAEDAFETMQELFISAKGMMGRLRGKDGAAYDFFGQAIGAEQTYAQMIDSIPADYLRYLDGYCQGINAFAKAHPERVLLRKVFPLSPKDILKGYIISFSALAGAPGQLQNIIKGELDKKPSTLNVGSNGYAFSSVKTKDGKTYLAINPHFMVDGPFSFYDAHLCSEEGLNMTGTLFQGGTCAFMGNNEYLGWGHTYNHPDLTDVFELEMKKGSKRKYKFDNEYLKLEKRPIRLKVRIGKKLVIPVKKMTYWSKYGPTFRSPNGRTYALRSPAFSAMRSGEQFYRMNKAKNFEEFKQALRLNALPLFNIVYADRDDNIYYLNNSMLPIRSDSFDYSGILPGNNSKNLWTEYYTIEQKPHVENPACGYVFNMNNTPSNATCPESNFPKFKPDKYCDLRPGDNNRSVRFMELVEGVDKMNWEEFKAIKFDRKQSKNSNFFNSLSNLFAINPANYPQLSEPIKLIQSWDGDANLDNSTASLVLISLQYIFKKKGYGDAVFISGVNISEAEYIEGIEYAARHLNKHFNTLHVPLGKLTCHERNGKLYCAAGFPDMLSPGYTKHTKEGRMQMDFADTYIHFVCFTKEGPETIQTLIPFEDTKTCEEYKDELEMFNKAELKTMSLNKFEIMQKGKKTYSPKL